MQRNHLLAMIAVAGLLPAPALAGPPTKKQPPCQVTKTQARDAKKAEPCRKTPPVPWVVDPTPLFLASAPASGAGTLFSSQEPVA